MCVCVREGGGVGSLFYNVALGVPYRFCNHLDEDGSLPKINEPLHEISNNVAF